VTSVSYVLVETPRPHVTLITLNRPERMNAMSFDVMIPFRQALEAASADNETAGALELSGSAVK